MRISFCKITLIDSVQKFIFLLFLAFCFREARSCPFDNYDDALLPLLKPIQILEIRNPSYKENQEDFFAFGYWSVCIPQQSFLTYPFINQDFDEFILESGQLLFALLGNGKTKLLGYLMIDDYYQTIQHNIIYFKNDLDLGWIQFNFQVSNYEGQQLFTLITFQKQNENIIVEVTGQEKQFIPLQVTEENLKIIVGGQGQFNNYFNLKAFRGRLSKIIFDPSIKYDEFTFSKFSLKCQIPPLFIGEQKIDLVSGVQLFDGNKMIQAQFLQIGDRYCLQGWIKYDFSKITKPVVFPLIRISTRKNYDYYEKVGDQQLIIQTSIDNILPQNSNIIIFRDTHFMPKYGEYLSYYNQDFTIFYEFQNTKFYHALSKWHYIYYEYGLKIYDFTSVILIQFYDEIGVKQKVCEGKQFTNSIFYIFIGGDNFQKNLLQASISDLKFYFNYENDKELNQQSCHYTCFFCDGPFETNCSSCTLDSNRIYLFELSKCECLTDFIDKGEEICQNFFSYFSSLKFNSLEKQIIFESRKCQTGYFYFMKSNNDFECIQCPFIQNTSFQCLECLLNPQEWYLDPICRSDLQKITQTQETPYFMNQRQSIKYDVYFITSFGLLTLYPQYQGFCDPTLMNNCFQAKQLHLGEYPFVYCKQNYYLNNNECIFSHPYCLEVDQFGNCQKSLNGMYQQNGEFYECPVNCPSCYFDNQTLKIKCQKCIEKYSLIQGECIQCGQNCKTCQQYTDIITEDTYLKCYQCIDNSKYFFSFDGINCQENTIKDCQYAFLADKNNIQKNTLDYQFTRRFDTENFILHCARCKEQQIYIFNEKICGYGLIKQCIFGYALQQCSLLVDDEFIKQVQQNNFYDFQGQILQFLYFDDQMICTTQQFCIEKLDKVDKQVQFSTQCMQYNKDCAICIANQQSQFQEDYIYTCLVCDSGFYSERSSGKCQKCPEELNCYQCFQQSVLEQDNWKINIRAFYFQFIEGYNQHPFRVYGQSNVQSDFQIYCSMCIDGFELYDQKCIKSCPSSCYKCKIINGENICIKCYANQQGRQLSLYNNQCIECPTNCALCIVRNQEQIYDINPLFQNKNYEHYSYQCLKSYENKNYYFDSDLNIFIDCKDQNSCFKQFKITMNLFCSKIDYYKEYESQISDEAKLLFEQQNILIDDLISGDSFKQFENDYFYLTSNQKQIKHIAIEIISQTEQVCIIENDALIQQKFSKNIYSAINVELSLNFTKSITILFSRTISFENFQKIEILGLFLIPQANQFLKQIIFLSEFRQSIIFKDIDFLQNDSTQVNSKISIYNIKSLQIQNFYISNIIATLPLMFFFIDQTSQSKLIQINNFVIKNGFFSNTILLYIMIGQDDYIEINNLYIQTTFTYSTILTTTGTQNIGQFFLKKFYIVESNFTNSSLIILCQFYSTIFHQIELRQSNFHSTNIIVINNNFLISDFLINQSQFSGGSLGIMNQNQLNEIPIQINCSNIQIIKNEFNQQSKIFLFQRYNNINSNFLIQGLNFIENTDLSSLATQIYKDVLDSLITLNLDSIIIKNLNIIRGYGTVELSILQPKKLIISNIFISQGENFRFQGLHQYLDCQLQNVIGISYLQSIRIQAALSTIINNLTIQKILIYNKPIIEYFSADIIFQNRAENIIFNNLNVIENLLLQTSTDSLLSLIMITSEQQTSIEFQNLTFQNNILHEYLQNQLQQSSLVLFIDSFQADVIINNSKFIGNSVYNSSDDIIYIKTINLIIINSEFESNSIFNYSILYQHILWGFDNNEVIFQEDLEEIFPILSKSGNGYLIVENLTISNCTFQNSKGSAGGGFQIITQKYSQVNLSHLLLRNLSDLFKSEFEYGGGFYIDGTASQSLYIDASNIDASHIHSRYQGGLFYIQSSKGRTQVILQNIIAYNVFSEQGSVLYLQFFSASSQQQFSLIKQIKVENSLQGLIQYYDEFFSKEFSDAEQFRVNYNMSVIYIENAVLAEFQDISIYSLLYQSVLLVSNFKDISIINLNIVGSYFKNYVLSFTPNLQNKNSIKMNQINIFDSQFGDIGKSNITCDNTNNQRQFISFKCNINKSQNSSPLQLQKLNKNSNLAYGKCFLLILLSNDQQPISVIQFFLLHSNTQTKLNQINLKNILCSLCQNGLIYYNFFGKNALKKQSISDLNIQNSNCGKQSCLNLLISLNTTTRIIQKDENQLGILNFKMIISHFYCERNIGYSGTCLFISNMQVKILNSYMAENIAIQNGGAIFISNSYHILIIKTVIINNKAFVGGGIYFENLNSIDYSKLKTKIQDNTAQYFANNLNSLPEKLVLSFSNLDEFLQSKVIQQDNEVRLESVIINSHKQIHGEITNSFYLPSGISVKKYQYFDWRDNKYFPFSKRFRVFAQNHKNEIIKKLSGSYCEIKSRQINISSENEDIEFVNNFTNIRQIQFDEQTDDYNFDDIIIYSNTKSPNEIMIQLEFQCSSVKVPIYDQNYPYLIKSYYKQYGLRLNVKALPCQFGEILNSTGFSCQQCESDQGQYSLRLNEFKCQIKDDISTLSVTAAQLNLKSKYWRPFFDSSEISFCLNLPENCLGGWISGYPSCYLGHIGALCEQCDLYNVRGDGRYSTSEKYSCGRCNDQKQNIVLIFFVSIWTLILILISVQSNIKVIKECIRLVNLTFLGVASIYKQNKSSILIKILTNYFQIISFLSTFQLNLSNGILQILNTFGSPIQTLVYSLDCFISEQQEIQIQYARLIWQLIMPFIYIFIIFNSYFLSIKFKLLDFNKSVIPTTLIYMYIYLQPSLIGGLIELLSYREISNYKWQLANVAYLYDTNIHLSWMLKFILPVLIFLAIIVPLYFYILLYLNQTKLQDKETRLKWGYLYFEYKNQAYFWEVLKIVQKELMIIALTYYDDSIIFKALIISLILVLYIELNAIFKPYSIEKLNTIDRQQTLICTKSMILGGVIFISKQNSSIEISNIFSLALLIMNIYFLLVLLISILQEYFYNLIRKNELILDQFRDFITMKIPIVRRNTYLKKLFMNRSEKRFRTKQLYSKLKKFLLPQAKEILVFKQDQWNQATQNYNQQTIKEEFCESVPLSMRVNPQLQEIQRIYQQDLNTLKFNRQGMPSCISNNSDGQSEMKKSTVFGNINLQLKLFKK